MVENYRHFKAGPAPFGNQWQVEFLWLQNGISIRHADTVDVKFALSSTDAKMEKVVALPHPDLLALSKKTGRPLTDPWCCRIAALHIKHMIETAEDMDKWLVTLSVEGMERYHTMLEGAAIR